MNLAADPSRIREVFVAAVRMAADDREAYLSEACAGDETLRRRVEDLLAAHEQAGSFMAAPAVEVPLTADLDPPIFLTPPGTAIGRYKILEPIGEGGYGTVFMAEQTTPVQRKVALKIIKAGMDTRQVIARFEAERQAVALMDHPNIAKVFDAGVTENGSPFFVMELVKGTPITKYCDEHKLMPRERLELFIQVCQAVQHAHQKGIIHRDLKPTNVLIAQYDGKPVPKVIDFGVAKATGQRLTEATMFTGFGDVIGTPQYMSPEQAEVNQLDVDTRSDIYSLGVLLYELLTGTTPLEPKRVREAALLEVLRVIREEEPPRPSTRLTSTAELPIIAAQRGLEAKSLSGIVKGELDWIVMKALDKDRSRRYETATGFASDVQRYLADEQVLACPPSAVYRLKKFARRNKGPVLAVSLLVVTLAAGIIGTTWGMLEARRRAEGERQAKEQAEANFTLANEAVEQYLGTVTDDPELKRADFHPLRKKLLEGALPFLQRIAEQKSDDPKVEARRGRAYVRLGALRNALGENDAALQDERAARTIFARLSADFPDIPAYRNNLAVSLGHLGSTLHNLGKRDEAEAAYRQAVDIYDKLTTEFQDDPAYRSRLAMNLSNLGQLLVEFGDRPQGAAFFRRAVDICEQLATQFPHVTKYQSTLAMSYHNLGSLLDDLGRPVEAEAVLRKSLGIQQKLAIDLPDEPEYLRGLAKTHNTLGYLLGRLGRHEEAVAAHGQAVSIYDELAHRFRSVPDYRHELAGSLDNLSVELAYQEKHAEAEGAHRRALEIWERLADGFPTVLQYGVDLGKAYHNSGDTLRKSGQNEASLEWFIKAIERFDRVLAQQPDLVDARMGLRNGYWARAEALDALGRRSAATPDWERALKLDDGSEAPLLRLGLARNKKDAAGCLAATAEYESRKQADAGSLYNAACLRAVCAAMIADDPTTPAADAARLAQEQADLAMAWLTKAVATGFSNASHMKQDKDLGALRDREDFKKLVADLEATTQP